MMRNNIPREKGAADYTRQAAEKRLEFVQEKAGVTTAHLNQYSFNPEILPGNIELFSGAAQVPVGFAGLLSMNGSRCQGGKVYKFAEIVATTVLCRELSLESRSYSLRASKIPPVNAMGALCPLISETPV